MATCPVKQTIAYLRFFVTEDTEESLADQAEQMLKVRAFVSGMWPGERVAFYQDQCTLRKHPTHALETVISLLEQGLIKRLVVQNLSRLGSDADTIFRVLHAADEGRASIHSIEDRLNTSLPDRDGIEQRRVLRILSRAVLEQHLRREGRMPQGRGDYLKVKRYRHDTTPKKVWMLARDGFSFEDIAAKCKISVQHVEFLLRTYKAALARKKLKKKPIGTRDIAPGIWMGKKYLEEHLAFFDFPASVE